MNPRTARVHAVRDPVHGFLAHDDFERALLDSACVQRLRSIHQLATSFLVYPGATHRRFEHSIGVMALADRMFEVLTRPQNVSPGVAGLLPELAAGGETLACWRAVLRAAALLHDVGHLPFSHAAEDELLPDGADHHSLTAACIRDPAIAGILAAREPPLAVEDVVKLAVGPAYYGPSNSFTPWQALLAELIVGPAFGADRMDYLLRDSLHTGVAYGRFDHLRLVENLRVLEEDGRPSLGVRAGGLQSAEALLMARYFMFGQVYFHPVRRAYDIHLADFLKAWLPGGLFPLDVAAHLAMSDDLVWEAIRKAGEPGAAGSPGHEHARRFRERGHFRLVYRPTPADLGRDPAAAGKVYRALRERFGASSVRRDHDQPLQAAPDFPVLLDDGRVVRGSQASEFLMVLPVPVVDYVLIAPEHAKAARDWLTAELSGLLGGT